MEQRQKIPALDHHEFAALDHYRISRARPSIEERNLAENFSGNNQIKDGVLSLRGGRANTHGAGANGIEVRPCVAFAEE